jgi:sporulation protein YlmC with PRC-barrel domain
MKLLSILTACFLLCASVCVVDAQQQGASNQGKQQQGAQAGQNLVAKADKLKGSEVVNTQGQKLGKVDSIGLDLQSGKISYVAVEPEKGNKLVPVPFNMFGVLRNQQLVLNVDKDRLDAAPSFGKNSQPNWANTYWTQQVANYWGAAPSGIMVGQASSTGTGATSQQPTPMGSSQSTTNQQQQQPQGQQPPSGEAQQQPMGQQNR